MPRVSGGWLTSVILATQEAERAGISWFEASPDSSQDLSQNYPTQKKGWQSDSSGRAPS
jgi:hypothetical protein